MRGKLLFESSSQFATFVFGDRYEILNPALFLPCPLWRKFNTGIVTLEQATKELKFYKQHESKELQLKEVPNEYETIQMAFIGPKDPKIFSEFFELFLKNDNSPLVINSYHSNNLTIYFLINSEDEGFLPYIRLDNFLKTYII